MGGVGEAREPGNPFRFPTESLKKVGPPGRSAREIILKKNLLRRKEEIFSAGAFSKGD
jgi:hypothetical protein